MKKVKLAILAGAVSGMIGLTGAGSAQALTIPHSSIAGYSTDSGNVEQVQFRGRRGASRGRSVGRSFGRSRGGRRGIGTGAAVGLGILGLGVAGAIASQNYYGQRRCWYEDREVYNRYGDYAGIRQVRVCN
jgi:hypothetical protein